MGWVVNATPRPLYPRERDSVTHCIWGWVGPRAGLDGCGKSRPPPGFDHRAVQPVASRYTDWAIPGGTRYIMLTSKTALQYSNPLQSILLAARFKYVDFMKQSSQTLSNTRFWQRDRDNGSGLWWPSSWAIFLQEWEWIQHAPPKCRCGWCCIRYGELGFRSSR
jgi:hypothetical protein